MMIKSAEDKNIWERAYKKGFFIVGDTPSLISQELSYYMELPGRVLDIGCGTGRNSIFFARMGYEVDAVDIIDVFPDHYKEHGLINFHKNDGREIEFKNNNYLSIVATRFLHHHDGESVQWFFKKFNESLKPGGYLAISFAFLGEPFEKAGLPFFKHEPDQVLALANATGFSVMTKKQINKVPTGINGSRKMLGDSFEAIFQKST